MGQIESFFMYGRNIRKIKSLDYTCRSLVHRERETDGVNYYNLVFFGFKSIVYAE